MTINLMIRYKSSERKKLFMPVTSLSGFKEEWLPACNELGLEFIPHFETGYPIIELNKETLPPVIDELKRLRAYFVDKHGDDPELPYVVKYRLNVMIPILEKALDEFDEIEYVRV